MRTFPLIFLLITSTNLLYAQEEINKLTVERANLYRKYKETESLTSGLFGNRSKGDLQTTIDALQRESQWRRSQLLPTIRLVLAVLATDSLVSSLRWKLAIAALPMPELTDFATSSIQTLLPEDLWIAVEAISTLTNCYELNDLIALETTLRIQEDARLRRLALAALNAQVEIDGWNKSRRLRLAQYQNDPAAFIASTAQFIFPTPEMDAIAQ